MRAASYFLVFAVGVWLTYLFVSYSAIHGPHSSQVVESAPELDISYADFVSFLLTVVTIVLAMVAVGVGVVAAYTFREIKGDARKAVQKEIAKELQDLPRRIQEEVDRVAFRQRRTTSVDELEEGFDPTDIGER